MARGERLRRVVARFAHAALATLSGGCTPPPVAPPANAPPAANPSPPARPPANAVLPPAAPAPAPARVTVTITGVVARGPDGALEICPGEHLRPCAGVRVLGDVAPELLSNRQRSLVVRLGGTFDGADLALSSAALVGAPERIPAPQVQCAAPRPASPATDSPSPAAGARRAQLEQRYPARFAGIWWDRERGLYTAWFTGDASDLGEPALRDGVCLVGGARNSARELEARFEQVRRVLDEAGVQLVQGGLDVLRNRLTVHVENIDQARLARVNTAGAGALDVLSFIELADAPLEALPVPPPRGDVPLVTSPRRWDYVHMQALGHFELRLDEGAGCVYLVQPQNGERLLPIWPFGYAAYTNPLRIVDFDDVVVARAGAPEAFGGGHVPVPAALRERACGAEWAWSGAPNR
jgi:hypothetical protein